ncbi:MAG: tRNA lysidine(34) synthetase TilS [Synergistaceae bacterium]|jgi:tRNA(Ile)-lysidine synthase|nr:tRNA lysidine(34) synthetase TilS [Synergistaceae bacterium]
MQISAEKRLIREFESAGKRQGWWDAGGLLVACSGGGDSMALLSLARMAFKGRIAAAHLEHGLRGESSVADARFVEEYCRTHGITCHVRHRDVAACRMKGESCETAGRNIRYKFFEEVCRIEKLPFVATAHNAEDAAETVTHHFFRGTGIAGLSGITDIRGHIVRPLVRCGREELRAFLRERGIPWREDETNALNHYTRNKIRNQLMPWVRSNINEAAERALLGLADECSGLSGRLALEAAVFLRLVTRDHPFAFAAWDVSAARRLSDTQLPEVLRMQAARLGLPVLDRQRTLELCDLVRRGTRARFQWAGNVEVCCDKALIGWVTRDMLDSPRMERAVLSEAEPVSLRWGPWTLTFRLRRAGMDYRAAPGIWRGLMFSRDNCGVISISDANSFIGRNKTCFHVKIPWWSAHLTPFISWESERSFAYWLPGVRKEVRGDGDYVIIADICV